MAITHATSAPGTPPPAGLTVGGNEWNAAHVGGVDISALAGDLLPSVDDTYDIGSTSKRWSEGHFSDFVAFGDIPATTGVIRLSNTLQITARDSLDTTDVSLAELGSDNNVHIGNGAVNSGVIFGPFSNGSSMSFGNSAVEIALGPIDIQLSASSLDIYDADSNGGTLTVSPIPILLHGTYWDGAASQYEDVEVAFSMLDNSPIDSELKFTFHDKDSAKVSELHLSRALSLYPDTDNTGSLGIAGKTWGDIYATLPASDPGNNGMWVNAANHNAVTIGSGA